MLDQAADPVVLQAGVAPAVGRVVAAEAQVSNALEQSTPHGDRLPTPCRTCLHRLALTQVDDGATRVKISAEMVRKSGVHRGHRPDAVK